MTLYHGSNVSFTTVDLSKVSPAKDFGCGFYLTDSIECAKKTALQRVARTGGSACVMAFDFDGCSMSKLKVRKFDGLCGDWALFVLANRRLNASATDHNCDNRYDVVIGPIANDRISLQFRLFERGIITIDEFIRGLSYSKLYTQYSFHTDRALRELKYIEAINVR